MKIMFICTGNICRSAMAEAMLKKMLKDKHKENIEVYSCGISADDGDIPTENAVEVMKEYKIDPTPYKGSVVDVTNILRIALTSLTTTPDLYSIMQILGKEKIFARFDKMIAK